MQWASKIDSSAPIMEQATSYRALFYTKFSQMQDYESEYLRFWRRGKDHSSENINRPTPRRLPHIFNYVVWKKSMMLRYFLECLFYIF